MSLVAPLLIWLLWQCIGASLIVTTGTMGECGCCEGCPECCCECEDATIELSDVTYYDGVGGSTAYPGTWTAAATRTDTDPCRYVWDAIGPGFPDGYGSVGGGLYCTEGTEERGGGGDPELKTDRFGCWKAGDTGMGSASEGSMQISATCDPFVIVVKAWNFPGGTAYWEYTWTLTCAEGEAGDLLLLDSGEELLLDSGETLELE